MTTRRTTKRRAATQGRRTRTQGTAIRVALAVAGLTGTDLRRRLRLEGVRVSQSTIYNWLNDRTEPSVDIIRVIARITGRKMRELRVKA